MALTVKFKTKKQKKKRLNFGYIDIIQNLENSSSASNQIKLFSKFLLKGGCFLKTQIMVSTLIKSFDLFFLNNLDYIYKEYPNLIGIFEEIVYKKRNYLSVFDMTVSLVKPPFVIKSEMVSKKLRKKTRQKYLVKIVYKNENKRLGSAFQQLYYYSNKFNDSSFSVRLYKALALSFFEWKNSHLFKLKTTIFKKFFKA